MKYYAAFKNDLENDIAMRKHISIFPNWVQNDNYIPIITMK